MIEAGPVSVPAETTIRPVPGEWCFQVALDQVVASADGDHPPHGHLAQIEISDDEVTRRVGGLTRLRFDRAQHESALVALAGKPGLPVPEEWEEWEEL